MPLDNELELIQSAISGDQQAFRVLFEEYYSRAYALAYSIMRNADDAEEVLQEAFVKAYLGLNNFKGDSSFYTWLYRIVRNMAIDVKRKMSRRVQASPEEPDPARISSDDGYLTATSRRPDQVYENQEQVRRLHQALANLKEEQRSILVLREIEGLSYDEISTITGLNSGTVMSRLFYARKALQKFLADCSNVKSDGIME